MRICFFSAMNGLGGGELWILKAVRLLSGWGHQVSVICPYRTEFFAACQKEDLDVHGYYMGQGAPFHEPLYHFLRNRKIDLLHCTVIGGYWEQRVFEDILLRLNQERGAEPAALILKTGLPPIDALPPAYYGIGATSVTRRLHVVSPSLKDDYLAWLPEIRAALEDFVRVAREGIHLSRFTATEDQRAAARREWQIEPGSRLIACLARLHPMKGQDHLLLAAREVLRRHPEAKFIFAGDGEDRSRLEQLRDYLGLAEAVRFAGHVDDVASLLAATDVLCQPSVGDGLPNSLVEAMAAGVPVVASAVGGVPELIEHGETGWITQPHDIRQLQTAIEHLLDHPDEASRVAGPARRKVEEEYSLEANTRKLEAMLEAEIDEFRRAPSRITSPVLDWKPRTRVLFLMNALRTGGEETEVSILARRMNRREFDIRVLSAWQTQEQAPVLPELAAAGISIDTGCHSLATAEEKVGYILQKIRTEQVSVVVACQDTMLAYQVFQHLDPGECRLIEHAGIGPEVDRVPKDRTARHISVSKAIADRARSHMPDPEHAVHIPSMVDSSRFENLDRESLRESYGFGTDTVVTFVGRLDRKKGIGDLISAGEQILRRHKGIRFLIVGGPDAYQPEEANRLIAQAARLNNGKQHVVLTGARSDVPQLLCASDIFVLPARGEGMSHVILEAGAAGLPVIATDDGAAREQLQDGEAGILVPFGAPGSLAEAIEDLATHPAKRAQLGQTLRKRVVECYEAEKLVPAWERLVREVAAETAPAQAPAILHALPQDRLLPFPAEIQVETNTACNATCVMCPYPEVSKELPPGRMDEDLYRQILSQCAEQKTLWRIEPFLNNEPFTDTRIVDWIALAKQMVPHAMVTVTTNGSLVTPKVTDRLIRSGLDGIWFSFNGATKETYESIMGLSFDKVKRNIDYLLSVRPGSLQVFTNMIETMPMRGEIADNIEYWRSRGVQSGSSPLVNRAGNVSNFAELNYSPVNSRPVRICELLYHKMYIGYNGDVLLCCMDWRRRVVLGNAREQSLEEIWNGEKYQRYRQLHEQGRSGELDLCATCSYVYT